MSDWKEAGIQVIAISYDSPEILNEFASENDISFPLLADEESKVIEAFGLLNERGQAGTRNEGLSHPMTVLVDAKGVVRAKISATVRRRHGVDKLLETWSELDPPMDAGTQDTAKAEALQFKVKDIQGEEVSLSEFDGKVVVVVNVASRCGLTPQYEQLQALYDKHRDDGLVVLGFPCNQFGGQEPGSEAEIIEFCEKNYGVTFPLFSKIDVNGEQADPLYQFLCKQDVQPKGSGDVRWNFEKFVLDRKGQVAARFGSRVSPDSEEFAELIANLLSP